MMYAPLMTLALRHDFVDGPPPLRATLREPHAMARAGVLPKPGPASLSLWLEEGEPRPDALGFDIWTTDPDILRVTPPILAEGVTDLCLSPAAGPSEHRLQPAAAGPPGPMGRRALLRLTVTLPGDGVPELGLVIPSVEAIWAYHVLGRGASGLSIVDAEGEIRFDPSGPTVLPDGRIAECHRSDRPMALRARAPARFSLMRDGPFGPQTLVDALPGAGAITGFAEGRGPTARLQSDIYITL